MRPFAVSTVATCYHCNLLSSYTVATAVGAAASRSPDDVSSWTVQALYVGAVDTGTLSGPEAVMAAVDELFDGQPLTRRSTHVDLRLTDDGIFITDTLHRSFNFNELRRHL